MSKFDTHGGYFAPKDYLRVNEGGSHEENPNGGVQIGVDPEGNPNLLEEGEPVYKDYVYSDNIEAEEQFLVDNNLPKKYAGKLYSKIADDLFSEAEERPLDPISRNGLEALLGRLADAQEGQKQAKEQRDLEDELAQLSPEELDQLEAMLAQGEQEQMTPEQAPIEVAPEQMVGPSEPMPVEGMPMMAFGGKVNHFDEGGDAYRRFMKLLTDYDVSKNRGGIEGMYRIDRNFDPYLRGNKNLGALEHDPRYVAFTDLVKKKADEGNRRALMYLSQLDNGVADWTDRLFDQNGNLRNGWESIYDDRRYDGDAGIYHLIPEFNDVKELDGFFDEPSAIEVGTVPTRGANPYDWYRSRAYNLLGQITSPGIGTFAHAWKDPEDSIIGPRLGDIVSANLSASPASSGPGNGNGSGQDTSASEYGYSPNILPTLPRYAGAIGSGLLGLYNAFQSPDRYTAPHINPVLPEGRINLQNQVYNPIDQNMIANAQIAQGNATNRALRNSGLGPSSAATILAADNNLTGNLGTGFIQAWDANNQRRNSVLAANNQAEAQRAQFDYTVDAARKDAINRLAPYNAQNDLMVQRLNNQAEAEKYQAISNQISNGLQALSGIGQENFAMNQVNTNPSFLGYRVAPNGAMRYMPWYSCNGGFLKKFKK